LQPIRHGYNLKDSDQCEQSIEGSGVVGTRVEKQILEGVEVWFCLAYLKGWQQEGRSDFYCFKQGGRGFYSRRMTLVFSCLLRPCILPETLQVLVDGRSPQSLLRGGQADSGTF
jgi:hypothetical protein